MKRLFTLSVFALLASAFGSGCEYYHSNLDRARDAEAGPADVLPTPDASPADDKDQTVIPEGEADDTDDGDTHNPYLHCENYETLTGCYWVDPVPGGRPPRPMVPTDGSGPVLDPVRPIAEPEDPASPVDPADHPLPPTGCVQDPSTDMILCYPPPPPPQQEPSAEPVNGFGTAPVHPLPPVTPVGNPPTVQPVDTIHPGIVVDPVHPRWPNINDAVTAFQ